VYHWGWVEHVDSYGLASSHTGVAFGGAIMLGWFFPAARVPLLLLASGTAMTRLAVGAHYASDVLAAVILSYAGCAVLWKLFSAMPGGQNHPGTIR
jgi:membrane-associated phospholipid phosphatase